MNVKKNTHTGKVEVVYKIVVESQKIRNSQGCELADYVTVTVY